VNDLEAQLVGIIQEDFPIEARPYRHLAQAVGVTEQEVISTLASLRRRGVIRDLSPVFDPKKLGYSTTLACMKVPADRIDEVSGIIGRHVEVTHNYLREHEYNVWFAIVAPGPDAVGRVIEQIEEKTGCGPIRSLPYSRVFKLRAVFEVTGE